MAMTIRQEKMTVLMLPWLAHGHISPFLELAKKLAANQSFIIYLCSTPTNLSTTKKKLSSKHSQSIHLVELHLPSLPDLPSRLHTTNGLSPHLMPTLKAALDMASEGFSQIMKTLNPDLLVYDFLMPWAPSMAASSLGIPAVLFLSTGAAVMSWFTHACKNPEDTINRFPFEAISIHDHEREKLTRMLTSSANGITDRDRFFGCLEQSTGLVLIKSFREIEGKYLDYFSGLTNKKIVAVGPLVEDPIEEDEKTDVERWLNRTTNPGVVFVSFGSEYFLSREEIEEVAYGLELSEMNFIWVIRFPVGEKVKLEEALPEGFLERVGEERGRFVEGWAPQTKILEHSSVGGFVSHCGWSSVMEAMKFGVPIIAMPMHLDQPLNARLVEEVGAGVEVRREKNGKLERKEIARVIREVVVGMEGERVRKKAKELRENMRRRGDEEIDAAVEELTTLCGRRKG